MNHSSEPDDGLDAATSERLLGGAEDARADERVAGLAALLAKAGEPLTGRPEDEAAALAHFRREYGAPAPRGRFALPRRYGGKSAVAVAAVVLALGGVALAIQPQVLTRPFGSGGHSPVPRPSVVPPSAVPEPSRRSGPSAPATPPAGSASGAVASPSPPSPVPRTTTATAAAAQQGTRGLCTLHVVAVQRGRSLSAASQARLAELAGGPSRVDAYCAGVLGTALPDGGPSSTGRPVPTDRPTASADRAAPRHANGRDGEGANPRPGRAPER